MENQKFYYYGMRHPRGFAPGCQPRHDLHHAEHGDGKYYAILAYTKELSPKECFNYELDYIERR